MCVYIYVYIYIYTHMCVTIICMCYVNNIPPPPPSTLPLERPPSRPPNKGFFYDRWNLDYAKREYKAQWNSYLNMLLACVLFGLPDVKQWRGSFCTMQSH